jgi:putative hemolysin
MREDYPNHKPPHAGALAHFLKPAAVPPFAQKFFPAYKMRELFDRVRQSSEGFGVEKLLAAMRVQLSVEESDFARIPSKGPAVVVANHPFGILDEIALAALLTRVRPDVRLLTRDPVGDIPELASHCIFLDSPENDPFASDTTTEGESNNRSYGEALSWLQGGGVLAAFPAQEVSHLHLPQAEISDPAWNETAACLIRRTEAAALPVFFSGHNSIGFQLFGNIHPRLRSTFLLQEFLQQEGRTIKVRVGSAISADSISSIADDREATEYLRWRTYLLARRSRGEKHWPDAVRSKISAKMQKPVACAEPSELLAEELSCLAPDRLLAENGDFAVYLAKASEVPHMLHELGRLREVTFRLAGEGVGRARDLDRFDRYYWHLLLWHAGKKELVGAYRAGNTAEIIAERGITGLYTSTLFRYDARVFEKIGPALEVGRSFVRPEYQRQYSPLLLLWKAIGQLLTTHVKAPILFGAVSVSNDYSRASREMIYRFFEKRIREDELAGLIVPRQPFRPAALRPWDCRAMYCALREIDELSQPITDLEKDGKGLPILLRQYAKIGGRLIGFSIDKSFSNTLDGLIMVDLRKTEPTMLERYMGHEAAARFRQAHGVKRGIRDQTFSPA